MPVCAPPPGFGTGPWGKTPWGGSLAPVIGGFLPTVPPFDIYCVGPCGPISTILTHPEVTTAGSPAQFPVDLGTLDQEMISGGSFPTSDAVMFISKTIPEDFTFEFTAIWKDLPSDFGDLVRRHSYFGTFDAAGGCVGLFFSKIGILYTGAVHLDGLGDLILDTATQPLPDSQLLVSEDEYWTVRIAMGFSTGVVYIYVTKTSELLTIGHQLRYVMPAIPSSSAVTAPGDMTLVSVRGTISAPTRMDLNSICLATGLIIPNIPPHADAGIDQALRICSVLQLDGTKSFDPEGAPLLYKWRLIDGPTGSQNIYEEADGRTYPLPIPTGFTNRLYSGSLAALNSISPIPVGDVVVIGGKVHDIVSTGTDGFGFFVRVEGYVLPDSYSTNTAFKYIRQNGVNTPTSAKPTFYPDIPGLYKFDLVVFDGSLFSKPSITVVNVVESVVARGCTPDLTFLWGYLSDFWQLVEDKDRITTFWQGLAQIAASELLTLWQIDYSKSLRDIQRTFQRKWLHYDMLMQENPNLIELSKVRAVFGGLESSIVAVPGIPGVSGTHLDLQLAGYALPAIIHFTAADPFTPTQIQAVLQAALAQIDSRIRVKVVLDRGGTISRLRIDAPFPMEVMTSSTLPIFAIGSKNESPSGTAGASVITKRTYRVERSLQFLDIQLNDFLCIEGVAYRIARVIDDPSDPWPFQRLTLLDDLPIPTGASWSISGAASSVDLDFWAGLCEQSDIVTFEVLELATNALAEVQSVVVASSEPLPHSLPVDATPVGFFLSQPAVFSVFLKSVLRRRYIPVDPLITDVPLLQEFIVNKDDTQVLRRNVDFFFDTFRGHRCLRFITPVPASTPGLDVWQGGPPPAQLWAETSYLDNRPRIEQNFGLPAEFTLDDLAELPSTIDYLSAVRGLWYSYFNGPTLFNLRAGTQILLGLPFAEETGVIVEIRDDFSDTSGRILVRDVADTTVVRSYSYPAILDIEVNPATGKPYAVGDTVQQFAPLVTGVEVTDYVKDPKWFRGYLQQGVFFEVEKFFKFLVRIDAAAFNLAALLFARTFVLRIKPTYTYPLFVVLVTVPDTEVSVSTLLLIHGTLHISDGACFRGTMGVATMYDHARTAFGGYRSAFDAGPDPTAPPIYPTPSPVSWGFDKMYLCPEDSIIGTCCVTFAVPTLPTFDSIFAFDSPVYTTETAVFDDGMLTTIPASPAGLVVGVSHTFLVAGTLTDVHLKLLASDVGTPATYNIVIKKNAVTIATVPFTPVVGGFFFDSAIPPTAVIPGDVLTCSIVSTGPGPVLVFWDSVLVSVGAAVTWSYAVPLPAGTYCVYKDM